MKRLVLVFFWLALIVFPEDRAHAKTDCGECFRECEHLVSLYKESFQQQGKGNDPRLEDKIRAARERLSKCLRLHGADGAYADKIVEQLQEEAKSEP